MIKVNSKFGHSVVDFSKDGENYLLLTLTGEKLKTEKERPPIKIAALLDISSSMSPDFKIGYLKKSGVKLVENLKETDELALIVYSTNAQVILPLSKMDTENKKKAIDLINKLAVQSMTNISEAITLGFNAFKDTLLTEGINRVILFTDGCPTAGNCNDGFLVQLAKNVPNGVQLTTMGYGKPNEPNGMNAFNGMGGELNVLLLQQMAEKGKGNYYYMSDPDSCGRAFANELAGLLTVVGQNIKISITPKDIGLPVTRMQIMEVLDDYAVEDKNGTAVISIPDIFAEETKYVLLKVKTFAIDKAWARPASIADIKVEYSNVIDGRVDSIDKSAKINFAKSGFTKEMDLEVKTQLEILNAIKAQEEAIKLANVGNFTGAQSVLNAAVVTLNGVGTDRAESFIAGMNLTKDFYADSHTYTANMNNISSGIYSMKGGRACGGAFDAVYTTSSQMELQNKFVDDPQIPDNSLPDNTNNIKNTKQTTSFSKKTKTTRW